MYILYLPSVYRKVFITVFVTSVSRGDDLKELFCRYGTVRDVYIPLDYHTREPRGFCYVEYPLH